MITLSFQDKPIHLPTNHTEVLYSHVEKMGGLTFNNAVLFYFNLESLSLPEQQHEYLKGLLSFIDEPLPEYTYTNTNILKLPLYPWYLLTRSFYAGLQEYTGLDITQLPYYEAKAIIEFYTGQLKMIDRVFPELSEDLRTDAEKQTQPEGYWDKVQDEILFRSIGCSLTDNTTEVMKSINLYRFFSDRLVTHLAAKSTKRQHEIANQRR